MKKDVPAPPRSPTFVAMMRRYGRTTTVHKDRRTPRGGTKNKQREYLADA